MCILYSESVVVSFLSASIASESPTNLRVCVCSVGCGCDQCLQRCCISSLRTQSLFNVTLHFLQMASQSLFRQRSDIRELVRDIAEAIGPG